MQSDHPAHFYFDDYTFASPDWLNVGWHVVIILIAGMTAWLYAYHTIYAYSTRRKARFAGVALLSATLLWGNLFHVHDRINLRTPLYTIALATLLYGSLVSFGRKPK